MKENTGFGQAEPEGKENNLWGSQPLRKWWMGNREQEPMSSMWWENDGWRNHVGKMEEFQDQAKLSLLCCQHETYFQAGEEHDQTVFRKIKSVILHLD